MPFRQPNRKYGPPVPDLHVIEWPATVHASPPEHALAVIAFYRVTDRPGEVWSARKQKWIPDTDERYLRWKQHPWAVETEHATEDDLADHMHRLGGRARGHAPKVRRKSFRARELFAVLTADDVANVQIALDDETAHAKSEKAAGRAPQTPLRLLWASLQAQGDAPVGVIDARFQAGWAGLRQALGAARASAIAAAINIKEPA